MCVTVFGATGGTGQHLVRQALAAGHHVTAVVRNPARLNHADHPRLEPVIADAMDPDAIGETLTGQDAVVSVLGPRVRGDVSVCADGARAIVATLDAPTTVGHTIGLGY
ncbi:NAD(P)-dependent oxidoreductase [Plantactinospora soyae]|uniref:Uncharacterized protein YbjT (DUF2867 family) n=1 Tax=Plantactinospora soyae TaxID=1544732 RepID=A0A927M1F0_9ACTN|nr:NAD(P)H-binding protein [Plantactinospora soyae]MBE1486393.1 uncharacterized protein YbjT (DUF2867 family) [Plantactinospora soyae]